MNPDSRFTISPLSQEDGGGFVIEYPDYPGCWSRGDTILLAIENGEKAKEEWLKGVENIYRSLRDINDVGAGHAEQVRNSFVVRVPRILFAKAAKVAKQKNMSINHFILSELQRVISGYLRS